MRHKTWTLKTIENGETTETRGGLSHVEAVAAIYRAIDGDDPLTAEPRAISADAETGEQRIPVAA